MKYLIVSAPCEGGKELLAELEHVGFKTASVPKTENNYKSYADNADVILISFAQMKPFLESYPDVYFYLAYVQRDDGCEDKWYDFALTKGGFETTNDFEDAVRSENDAYAAFKSLIDNSEPIAPNCDCIINVHNDFEKSLTGWAEYLKKHSVRHKRLRIIIETLVQHHILTSIKPGTVNIVYKDEKTNTPCPKDVNIDNVCTALLNDNEGMARIMQEFLLLDTIPVL